MVIPQTNIQAYRRQFSTQNSMAQVPIIIVNENIRNQRFTGTHVALSRERNAQSAVSCEFGCYQSDSCPVHNIYCPVYFNGRNVETGGNEWFV